MSDFSKIDKNFKVETVNDKALTFYNCLEAPFKVYGLILPTQEEPRFMRLPQAVADRVSKGVSGLACHTAGGRVRFATDSKTVAIRVKMCRITRLPHFSLTGSAGLDLYSQDGYCNTFVPPQEMEDGFTTAVVRKEEGLKNLTIHFPLYSGVTSLEIGLEPGCTLLEAPEYRITTPVVYYGSSVTQGACASRPGCSYENAITRRLECDHVNLGFSGSAMAEDEMIKYLAGLKMSAFVQDYDHNAPDPAHLEKTHYKLYKAIREAHPSLPIILISQLQDRLNAEKAQRREIIRETFEKARAAGDNNVWFLDGTQVMAQFGSGCGMTDTAHPNDLGFACMAKAVGDILEKVL